MLKEPYRLIRWKSDRSPFTGKLFTCARPGRSKGAKKKIADEWVDTWVKGLPGLERIIIISLLGRKPNGKSEFSFYSFRGGFDEPAERPTCPTFQEWLDGRYGDGKYRVLEHPTIDTLPLEPETLSQVSEIVLSLVGEGQIVVLMDSGGFSRVGKVCKYIGFLPEG
jgi:hypothetical protein